MVSSKIFRSRWSALFWSAGILWTAYDVATAAPHRPAANAASNDTDATGEEVTGNDLAILANAIGG